LVTTAPAATSAQRPTVTGATQTARAPIAAPSPIVTPTAVQSAPDFTRPSGVTARGYSSFVSTAAGPMNTPSPRTTPWADVRAAADVAVPADRGALADLREVPDPGAGADPGPRRHRRWARS
jgi:hypothetical protein